MTVSRRQALFALASPVLLSACGGDSDATTSDIQWTQAKRQSDSNGLASVCYGNSVFAAVGSADPTPNQELHRTVSYSLDGRSWTAVPMNVGGQDIGRIMAMAFGNGRFVAVSETGRIFGSVDGQIWNLVASNPTASFYTVAFGNGQFIISGTAQGSWIAMTWHSLDGLTWSEPVSSGIGFALAPIKFVNGIACAFPLGARVRMLWQSTDSGVSWVQSYVEVNGKIVDISDMTYGNGTYVASTDAGTILTSTDRVVWTERHRFDPTNYTNLNYLGNTFALTNGQSILTSIDALNWNETQVGQRGDILDSTVFDGHQFVAVGYPGLVMLGTSV
jgi:hypothetical protein